MNKSIFFFKQLTATEVGRTSTHEVYVRLPNDFDEEDFFQSELEENNGVREKIFKAKNLTKGHEEEELVTLRYVYFYNSNNEKRIPSLGELFKKNNVEEGDVFRIESRIVDGEPHFFITFYKADDIRISTKQVCFTIPAGYNASGHTPSFKKPLQQIFYGAPGTGKSHKIKERLESVSNENIFRTTFHPDSDYSTFVGAYKPTMEKRKDVVYSKGELISELTGLKNSGVTYPSQKFGTKYWRSLRAMSTSDKKDILHACNMPDSLTVEVDKGIALGEEFLANSGESRIVYSFVAQAFLNAYIRAYQTEEDVYLIIEEINRGNCAQIFGDLFQLLDRDKNGVSEYPIKADADLRSFLEDELGIDNPGIAGGELRLPANLHIWATMNTSDQSLFPIDSAFKRRWDWHYIPISQGKDKYGQLMNWEIIAGDKKYSWWSFLTEINKHIWDTTHSEDKKLGFFFCYTPDGKISADTFVGKVIFYLWNDVFKDYGFNDPIFNGDNNEPMKFDEFYTSGSEEAEANTSTIQKFLDNLKVDLVSEDKSNTAEE